MSDSLPLLVANLKANKTWEEVTSWLEQVGPKAHEFDGTVVFCPSTPFLAAASLEIKEKNYKIHLGAQNISKFEQGPYTGELAVSQIKDMVQYTIIGHSERRNNFDEDDQLLETKVKLANDAGVKTIYCVQDENTTIPEGTHVVAYEPLRAIGTGNPDTPENAQDVSLKIKEKGDYKVLYGGSVYDANVKSFLKKNVIDGVLVGTASLNSESFCKILESAKY